MQIERAGALERAILAVAASAMVLAGCTHRTVESSRATSATRFATPQTALANYHAQQSCQKDARRLVNSVQSNDADIMKASAPIKSVTWIENNYSTAAGDCFVVYDTDWSTDQFSVKKTLTNGPGASEIKVHEETVESATRSIVYGDWKVRTQNKWRPVKLTPVVSGGIKLMGVPVILSSTVTCWTRKRGAISACAAWSQFVRYKDRLMDTAPST